MPPTNPATFNRIWERPQCGQRLRNELTANFCSYPESWYQAKVSLSPSLPSQTIAIAPRPSPFDYSLSIYLFSCRCPLPSSSAVCVWRQIGFLPRSRRSERRRQTSERQLGAISMPPSFNGAHLRLWNVRYAGDVLRVFNIQSCYQAT